MGIVLALTDLAVTLSSLSSQWYSSCIVSRGYVVGACDSREIRETSRRGLAARSYDALLLYSVRTSAIGMHTAMLSRTLWRNAKAAAKRDVAARFGHGVGMRGDGRPEAGQTRLTAWDTVCRGG